MQLLLLVVAYVDVVTFKKKRPVKTKNFPKLGDSALPQSSCKALNPA